MKEEVFSSRFSCSEC